MLNQQVLTGARRQRVRIERRIVAGGPEWKVTFDGGRTDTFDTAQAALNAVRSDATNGNGSVTITAIDWLGVPDRWRPPT